MHDRSAEPLAPRWGPCELDGVRAGTRRIARVQLENGGGATWRSFGAEGLQLSYHWLDVRGNAIVWDGLRTAFPHPLGPGEHATLEVPVDVPRPPGRYVLRFDLVEEHRFWLSELGVPTLDLDIEVEPRIAERRLTVVVHGGDDARTTAALAAQEEPVVVGDGAAVAHLVAGAEPEPSWSRLLLDAHAEGWEAVGPALVPTGGPIERRRAARRLAPWAPAGRNPRPGHPLLLPSLVDGLSPAEHEGLAAYTGEGGLFEGRAVVRLPTRSGRRRR
ncbi:MAG: hypothetical protein ACRC50_06605 [Gaiella sp.]